MSEECSNPECPNKETGVTNKDRLDAMISLLVQTRRDIIADKASLDRMFVAKAVVVASVLASMATAYVDAVVAATPFIIMVLDYVYKKRLNEIFSRWNYLSDELITRIDVISGISKIEISETENAYFEQDVVSRESEILNEERYSKTFFLVVWLLLSCWGLVWFMKTNLHWTNTNHLSLFALAFSAVLGAVYAICFLSSDKFKKTHHVGSIYISLVLSLVMLLIFLQDGFASLGVSI